MTTATLIGYRGTGKSTVARLLAERLGTVWVDADELLEQRLGRTIASMVREKGEASFREAESVMLAELLTTCRGVLATGGGVVLRDANRRLLHERGRPMIWLTAPVDVIRSRLSADPATADRRPALAGRDALDEVETSLREREPLYRSCADWSIDTSELAPEAVAHRIADWLESRLRVAARGGAS